MPTTLTANSRHAVIAKAILAACKPCCGAGSGVGSGSGSSAQPCTVLPSLGGADVYLNYEVTGDCTGGSGADVVWTGAACGAGALFNGGTSNIFIGADTTFDGDDVPGPTILFQWCDGENTNPNPSTLLEFAWCCMERVDGSTYLAFYALLTHNCATGQILYAFKSRDIAYVAGDPTILSITGLSAFASLNSTPGCTCTTPSLSVAWRVDLP